jgi:DNA-binding SARP family transcriptional activator
VNAGALRVYLCGQLAIEYNATVIAERDFPARQGRRAWAYLALHRKLPVGRDDLGEAIWGDEIPDRWDSTINGIVSRLRAMLRCHTIPPAAARIDSDLGRYHLVISTTAAIDWERARVAIHAADTTLSRRDYHGTLAEARVAMEIASRGFLIGENGAWIEGQRRALDAIHLRALECTVSAEIGRGRTDLAEREARELLRRDPLQERAYRLLMQAYAASGNRGQVRHVMEECRVALETHAASTPSRETISLFRALMSDR